MSTAPARTRSPERAAMRVTNPSTCGCTVAERRDFTVAMNSLVCSTGFTASVMTSTGMGGNAPPGGPPAPGAPDPPRLQPAVRTADRQAVTVKVFRERVFIERNATRDMR